MVDARELRIGNLFELKNSGLIRVDADNLGHIIINPAILQAVPLTPELLEKCGFIYDDEYSVGVLVEVWKKEVFWIEKSIDGYRFFFFCEGDEYYSQSVGNAISSLHQLQNLHYFLVGKELEINL